MAALDSLLKNAAKTIVADLGSSLDTTISYTRKVSPSYNTATGAVTTTDTAYSSISVPIEYINSQETSDKEIREAKIYLTPDLIGGNQPTFHDEVILSYGGSNRTAQITDIRTLQGGQTYLFILLVRF
jgi:hypothetical protein